MTKHLYKKTEDINVQGICVRCERNKQTSMGLGRYRPLCNSCHKTRHNQIDYSYRDHKKDHCERCGFLPEHLCQLDVDHIDGNHSNNDPSNLQTLCANCHRLKTMADNDN